MEYSVKRDWHVANNFSWKFARAGICALSKFDDPNSKDLFTDGISMPFILELRIQLLGTHGPKTHISFMGHSRHFVWKTHFLHLMHFHASCMYFEPTHRTLHHPRILRQAAYGFRPESKWNLCGFFELFTHSSTPNRQPNRHRHSMKLAF